MFTALLLLAMQAVEPPVPIAPESWFTGKDFPYKALKDDFGGKVGYVVDVDASGNPRDCHILSTSGQDVLDQAACKTVMVRGRFQPARDTNGLAVPGTYKGTVTWTKPDWSSQTYQATILDFSRDPQRPTCTVRREGELRDDNYSCEHMLGQEALMKRMGKEYKLVAFLNASAGDGAHIYRGEASWGERLTFMASDQYYRADGSFPFACISVAAEGWDAGRDACGSFPGARTLGEGEKTESRKSRSEISIFGLRR